MKKRLSVALCLISALRCPRELSIVILVVFLWNLRYCPSLSVLDVHFGNITNFGHSTS